MQTPEGVEEGADPRKKDRADTNMDVQHGTKPDAEL